MRTLSCCPQRGHEAAECAPFHAARNGTRAGESCNGTASARDSGPSLHTGKAQVYCLTFSNHPGDYVLCMQRYGQFDTRPFSERDAHAALDISNTSKISEACDTLF